MKPKFKKNKISTLCLLFFLTVCCATNTFSQLQANFLSSLQGGCSPILVNFTDISTGSPTEWKWDLGNGTFSNLQNPSVTYFNPGTYTIKLIVKGAAGQDSVKRINYITVYQGPSVNLTADVTTGCNPLTVKFTDISTTTSGSLSAWQWDFGDGILSPEHNPVHQYTSSGNFSVSLKVANTAGCSSTIKLANYINNNGVKAAFTNAAAATCTPKKIVFKNTSVSNGNMFYAWDFGDGDTSSQAAPTHNYIKPGNYTVKLSVKSQQGCSDAVSSDIQVTEQVSADFSANNVRGCKAPFRVNFSNQTLTGNNYYWQFGDSTISNISNPVHEFSDTGSYSIKLIIRNTNGCVDSVKKDAYVVINKPIVGFSNLPDSSCSPFTKTMSAFANPASKIVSYTWLFGDGMSSADKTPTHTYVNAGYYTITLQATAENGCADTFVMPAAIRVSLKPVAKFSANSSNSCAGSFVTFTNLTTGSADAWVWDFGDNTLDFNKTPQHAFRDTGYRTVTIIALSGGCADTAKIQNFIYIKPAVAKFNLLLNCSQPFVRSFYNYSVSATSFQWDFGDGTFSSDTSPVHTFPHTGVFPVKITVKNDSTGCVSSITKQVTVLNVKATFAANKTNVCKGDSIIFSSPLSTSEVARFYWDFGDGEYIYVKESSIAHVYQKSGTYTVRLITIDFLNCRDTLVRSAYIHVNGPKANFSIVKNTCFGTPVIFADSSKADVQSQLNKWEWNYGDGKIDTAYSGPFEHVYPRPGFFMVSLKVTDAKGCTDTFSLQQLVNVTKISARFYVYDAPTCATKAVRFVCTYWQPGVQYGYSFGDGDSSNLQLPTHNYLNEGTYNVKVWVKDDLGCTDTATILNAVRVINPIARFTMSDSFRTCPPLVVQFTSTSLNTVEEYWDFGDSSYSTAKNPSHFYTYPGVYTVTLYAKSAGGCVNTTQKTITVKGPKGSISYDPLSMCRPYKVNLRAHAVDAVSYIWDFSDGVTLNNTDSVVQHVYQDSGIFTPKVMLIDDIGCRVPVTGRDTITNIFATAKFTFPDRTLCDNDAVHLTNTTFSNDEISTYQWNFGNGNTSAEKEPDYQYTTPGLYFPSLKVITKSGCTNTFTAAIALKVARSSNVEIQATANGCVPINITLKGIKLSSDTAAIHWNWDFQNGHTDTSQTPAPQLYTNAGIYNVILTAINSNGCKKSVSKPVEAFAIPVLRLSGDSTICRGGTMMLHASGAATYKWFPATNLSCTDCHTTLAKPPSSFTYIVTGTSDRGCIKIDSVSIAVKQPFKMKYSAPDKLCAGQTKRLQASGATIYRWTPATGLNSSTSPTPEARPDSTTTYRIVGTDEIGCFQDTGYVCLTVHPLPTVDAGEDKTINVGSSVDLKAKISSDVTEVNWTPTGDIFRNNQDAITVKPNTNTEYTIDVKNAGGCAARDRVNILVVCNGSNVFLPTLFSPNGDGSNDIFYPRGTGLYKIKTLRVFNRWGEAVFQKSSFNANDPSSGWDGTYKGAPLGSDTFIYLMDLICDNNSILTLKGNVTLVR